MGECLQIAAGSTISMDTEESGLVQAFHKADDSSTLYISLSDLIWYNTNILLTIIS